MISSDEIAKIIAAELDKDYGDDMYGGWVVMRGLAEALADYFGRPPGHTDEECPDPHYCSYHSEWAVEFDRAEFMRVAMGGADDD